MAREFEYFSHMSCEFFPCHPHADPDDFNCLFCYCPLYVLGDTCGGDFAFLENGVKDCSACLFPHERRNYEAITGRFAEISACMARNRLEPSDGNQA